jgi:hypothetical protein
VKKLDLFQFSPAKCRAELDSMRCLLDPVRPLKERDEILPFFRKNRHLAAFIGSYFNRIVNFDRIGHELALFGDFTVDLATGDSKKNAYCLIEFEEALPMSLFRKSGRATPAWSATLERGFSQLVDWGCALDDLARTNAFASVFGSAEAKVMLVLVVGRSVNLDAKEVRRLEWRQEKVGIDGRQALLLTFDLLYNELHERLQTYEVAAVPSV